MLTIIKFTFKEHLTRKVVLFSLILAAVYLGLYGTGVHHAAKSLAAHPNPIMESVVFFQLLTLGLYFGSFIVSFLAIFSAAGTISAEIENGVMQTIVAKPIRRSTILLGKFFGSGLFLAAYAAALFGVIFLIMQLQTGLALEGLWKAMALFALQPIVLLAVTLCGSTIIPTVANGVLAFAVFFIGIIGGIVEQIGWVINNASLQQAGIISSLIMPADALYRKIVHVLIDPSANPITAVQQLGPFGSMSEPSIWMVVYAVLYVIFFTGLATYLFTRRDI